MSDRKVAHFFVIFCPKTPKNGTPKFNFRHNTCISPKKVVNLHAKLVQKENRAKRINMADLLQTIERYRQLGIEEQISIKMPFMMSQMI